MFQTTRRRSTPQVIFSLFELSFLGAVRKVRSTHRNAFAALAVNLMQAILFVAVFYLMFTLLGTRAVAIRGNFLIYLLTGIFMYMTHIKALGAVMGAEGPTSAMMQHAPMNTIVAIVSAALSALYLQVISLFVILFLIHTVIEPVVIHQWGPSLLLFLLAWFSGCCVGMILMALKPWFPTGVSIIQTFYTRANMLASGKMFVANMLPSSMIAIFDWNPLFHVIDQLRGFVFINYNPHHSNWEYPLYASLVLMLIGLMGEFYTRKHASLSWGAGQ